MAMAGILASTNLLNSLFLPSATGMSSGRPTAACHPPPTRAARSDSAGQWTGDLGLWESFRKCP